MKKTSVTTVLHICNYAAPYKGNFIESLQYFGQDERAKNVYLFTHRARSTAAAEWIEELRRGGADAYIQEAGMIKNVRLLRHIIKTHGVGFMFCHFYDIKMDAILKLFFPSKRVARFFHCMYSATGGLKHQLRRFLWRNNKLVGVSEPVSQSLRQCFGGFQVHTVENAIRFDRLDRVDEFERSPKLSLLTMGYNVQVKGVDLALKVAARLKDKYDLVLGIVVASHMQELTECIDSVLGGLPEWIILLPPVDNVATYYKGSDIFLSPSRSEAFGYAVVEAAYCKTGIVLSRVGGQAALQIDGA